MNTTTKLSRFELRQVGVLHPGDGDSDLVQGILVERLTIAATGVTAVVGASASGKSSLLNLLAGFSAPSPEVLGPDSQLTYIDADGCAWSLLDHGAGPPPGQLGFVFQDAYLLKSAAVGLNIGVGGLAGGTAMDNPMLRGLLRQVNLPGHYDLRRGRHLSGGEAQRVALCRALACSPRWILADEPTSGLDPTQSELLLSELRDWCHHDNRGLLWVTHNLELAARFADRVIVIAQGRPLPGYHWPLDLPALPEPAAPDFEDGVDARAAMLADWLHEARHHAPLDRSVLPAPGDPAAPGAAPILAPPPVPAPVASHASWRARAGFVLRLAWCELFSHPRVDRIAPTAALPAWTVYRRPDERHGFRWQHLLRAFHPWTLAWVTLLCVLMTWGSLQGQRLLGEYFARELARPEVRHVVVGYQRGLADDERDVPLPPHFLTKLANRLNQALAPATLADGAPPVQFFGRRFEHGTLFAPMPASGDCENRHGGGDNLLVAYFHEPLFAAARGRSPADWAAGAAARPVAALLAEANVPATAAALVTEAFLMQRLGADAGQPVPTRFCLLDGVPRPVTIVGVLDRLPGSDLSPFSFMIDEGNFRDAFIEAPRARDHRIPNYNAAAVYFQPERFQAVWDLLAAEGLEIPAEAFARLRALLRVALTTQIVLGIAIALILVLAATALWQIVTGYIQRNERAFFVMRAFGHGSGSLALLLIAQMAAVTLMVGGVTGLLLLAGLPWLGDLLGRGFGVAPHLLGLSAFALWLPLLLVFAIQALVSFHGSRAWWRVNRRIAERMQTI